MASTFIQRPRKLLLKLLLLILTVTLGSCSDEKEFHTVSIVIEGDDDYEVYFQVQAGYYESEISFRKYYERTFITDSKLLKFSMRCEYPTSYWTPSPYHVMYLWVDDKLVRIASFVDHLELNYDIDNPRYY